MIGFAAGGIPTVKLNRVLFRNIAVVGAAWGEYVRTHPGVDSVLVGPGTLAHLEAALATDGRTLSEAALRRIDEISHELAGTDASYAR